MPREVCAINLSRNGEITVYPNARTASDTLTISESSLSQALSKRTRKCRCPTGDWYTFMRSAEIVDEEDVYDHIAWAKVENNSLIARRARAENRKLLLTFIDDADVIEFLKKYKRDPSLIIENNNL